MIPNGWHLAGSNKKAHYFKKYDNVDAEYPKGVAQSICKKVSGYSGISKDPCDKIFKDKKYYMKFACNYCLTLVVQRNLKQ